MADQLIITKKMMDEDPNFASFSDVTSSAESDNTSSYRRPVVTLGGSWILDTLSSVISIFPPFVNNLRALCHSLRNCLDPIR